MWQQSAGSPNRDSVRQPPKRISLSQQVKEGMENRQSQMKAISPKNKMKQLVKKQMARPLKRSFSTEFYLRARQWRDVAEFERKELLKVRVYRSLRQASAALLSVAVITVIFSILDIEITYAEKGKMIPPSMPPIPLQKCQYRNCWNLTTSDIDSQQKIRNFLKGISFSVRVTISALTVLSLCLIWWYTELERRLLVVRYHLSDSIHLFNSPLAPGLYLELLCCVVHVPPCLGTDMIRPEWQLVTFIRLYHIVKYMREHHPMRYHRMTEILKTVASVKLSSTFLLKSYFLKKPLPMLLALYIFNVFAGGYIVFALERNHGTCMQYNDVVWMMGVTITNLGFGDFTPSSTVSRSMIALLSLLGIFQTALIVGVLSETLVIPPDEKRILASVEKQRADQIRRHAAAKLIQATWRQYRYNKNSMEDLDSYNYRKSNITNIFKFGNKTEDLDQRKRSTMKNNRKSGGYNSRKSSISAALIRDGRNFNRGYINALWQWRKVKTSTDTVGQSLEKEFLVDDTAITTTYISRKLDALEKLVRKGGPGSLLGPGPTSSETPKNKWLNAARDGLTKRSTLVSRITKTGSGKETSATGKVELPVKLNNETVAR
jgi:hypothetical protein